MSPSYTLREPPHSIINFSQVHKTKLVGKTPITPPVLLRGYRAVALLRSQDGNHMNLNPKFGFQVDLARSVIPLLLQYTLWSPFIQF